MKLRLACGRSLRFSRQIRALAMATAVMGVSSRTVFAQIASLDKGHSVLANNGLQIWGAYTDSNYFFDYPTMTAANINAVMYGFPTIGGTTVGSLSTGQKW